MEKAKGSAWEPKQQESIRRDTATLATATDTELEDSDRIADSEEDEDEFEKNELVPEDC